VIIKKHQPFLIIYGFNQNKLERLPLIIFSGYSITFE